MTYTFKLTIIGDSGVGKTSIVQRRVIDQIPDNYVGTVGFSNFQITENVNGIEAVMTVWDTAGQEEYSSLIPMFSRDSDICLFVVSIDFKESFEHINMWEDIVSGSGSNPIRILTVNKVDLVDDSEIPNKMAEYLPDDCKNHFDEIFYVSALTKKGICELFRWAAEKGIERKINNENNIETGLNLELTTQDSQIKRCCK